MRSSEEENQRIAEAIRRERGRKTRGQLCREYNISYYRLCGIIKRYELQTKQYTGTLYNSEYDRYLAKRQIAVECSATPGPPYKPGNLEWR